MAVLRVLGVDPGSVRTGYGVIERDGTRLRLITAGTLTAGEKAPLEERLLTIHTGLRALIDEYAPGAAAVEDIFFSPSRSASSVSIGLISRLSLSSAEMPGNWTETERAGISISGSPSLGRPT